MKQFKLTRMNERGVAHYVLPFIVLFAVAGAAYLVYAHAATATTYEVSNGNGICINDPGNQGQTGVDLTATTCTQVSRQVFALVGSGATTNWHTYKVFATSSAPECIGSAGNKQTPGTKLQAVGCSKALSLYVSTSKQLEVAKSGGICVDSASGSMILSNCANAGNWNPRQETVGTTGGGGGSGGSGGGVTTGQCGQGGSYLWSNLAKCGWPDATNTGPVASQCSGGKLTANSGSLTRTIKVTTANTTISCEDITGQLDIEAKGVTIKNVSISGSSGKTGTAANGTAVIFVGDGASATIDNVSINGNDKEHACVWHQGSSLSVDAINCTGIDDGIFSWASSSTAGDNFTIKDSYFHGFTTATANGHEDGYQTEGASNGTISHNTYEMTTAADSAVAIWDSLKSSSNITVSGNLITGGGFAIYAEDYSPSQASPTGSYTTKNITFTNNSFSTHAAACVGNYGVWFTVSNAYNGGPTDGWHRSGNKVLETGESIDSSNPHNKGAVCQ